MRKLRIKYLAAGVGLACWTTVASAGLFSASGPVIAIVADELFVGTATGHIDGTGTVVIRSQEHSDLKCAGEFASNGMLGGSPAKVAALIDFVGGGGRLGLITNADNVARALRGETGTRVVA